MRKVDLIGKFINGFGTVNERDIYPPTTTGLEPEILGEFQLMRFNYPVDALLSYGRQLTGPIYKLTHFDSSPVTFECYLSYPDMQIIRDIHELEYYNLKQVKRFSLQKIELTDE